MRKSVLGLLALVVIVAATLIGWSVVDNAVIRVDPAKTYQTMKVLHRLVNELGIDRVRIEIRSGAETPVDYRTAFEKGKIGYEDAKSHRYENINDNDDPLVLNLAGFQFVELDYRFDNVLLPIKRLIEANGEKLFINLIYVDFVKNTTRRGNLSHARHPEEYAELIHATFEHVKRKYGLVPDALEVILEPDNSDEWRGHEIGAAMVAAVRRLNRAGFFPQVIAPSTAWAALAPEYLDTMMEVPGVKEVAVAHCRAGAEVRRRDRDAGAPHGQRGGASHRSDRAQRDVLAAIRHRLLELRREDRKGGYFYLVDLDKREVKMSSRTPALGQYFKFVRAGAVRIDAVSNRADKKAVAFRNANGTHVVIVQATHRGGTISVAGVPAGVYGVRYTTADEIARELPAITIAPGETLTARLPAKGVITLHQKPAR